MWHTSDTVLFVFTLFFYKLISVYIYYFQVAQVYGMDLLMLGTEVPFVSDDEESMSGTNQSVVDKDKSISGLSSKHRQRIIAQTIVFYFLHEKEQDSYLILCLGIAKNYVIFSCMIVSMTSC